MDPLIIIPVAFLVALALIVYISVKNLSAKAPATADVESASETQVFVPEIVAEPEADPSSAVAEDEYQDRADAILKTGVTDSNSEDNMTLSEVVADPVADVAPVKSTKPRAPRKPKVEPSVTKAPRVGAERKPRKPKAQ